MKRYQFILIFIIFTSSSMIAQTAPIYLPTQIGNVWISDFYVLDSLGNPVSPPQVFVDSSINYTNFLGRQTLFIFRRPENSTIGDTLWISASNQSIFIHQRDFDVDTFFTVDLPDWLEYYRFFTSLGIAYTIFRIDTTITIPSFGTLPLRFIVRGTRLGSETITVPAGTFNSVKFKIDYVVQYRVDLPPPLPPLFIDIVNIPTFDWLAENRYIIKSYQQPVYVDTLNLTIPGTLRELVEFRVQTNVDDKELIVKDFQLFQNFPNPFNGMTTILFELNKKMYTELELYNSNGKLITKLLRGELNPGTYTFDLDANKYNLSSGVYFCKLNTLNYSKSIAMIYIK